MKRVAAFLLILLATTAVAAIPGTARADTPSCTVGYAVAAQWSGAFEAQITVSYTGFPAGNGWTLSFDFVSPGQRIQDVWNGMWSQYGSHVVGSSGPYPGIVPGSGSLTLGFVASYVTVNPPPVNFVFDGTACTMVSPTVSGAR